MAKIELTPEQKEVVNNRGGTLLVSAAAGSGKTKVLIDRVLKKVLTEGYNIDEFLMITFTKAAASELRAKLTNQMSKLLAEDPSNHHLQKQMNRVYLAQISTVHSFCKNLLQDYAHELDLPADFRLCDDQEKLMLKKRALTACMEQAYQQDKEDPEIQDTLNMLGHGRNDALLESLILKLFETLLCYKDPKARAEELRDSVRCPAEKDAGKTLWGAYILEEFRYWASGVAEQFLMLSNQALVNGIDHYVSLLQDNAATFRRLSKISSWEELRTADPDFGKLSSKRIGDKATKKAIQDKRNALIAMLTNKLNKYNLSSDEIREDMAKNAPALIGLIRLTERFSDLFSQEKKRRHVLDFNDLEHETLRLVCGKDGLPTRAAKEISQRYAEIMVDEYQDTNAVQDALFYAISRNGQNLFFVGDIKQSIYRFRMADPTIFREKYHTYSNYEDAIEGEPRKILLSDNFRSHPAILDAANWVFRLTMSDRVGGLHYTNAEALRAKRNAIDMGSPPVELHCVDSSRLGGYGRDVIEAEFVARRIEQMLKNEEKIPDEKGELRPIRPGDVVLLLRTMKDKAEIYVEALRRHQIRGVCADNNIFSADEVQLMTALLQIIDNPHQDIPLLTVLLSPLFRFSAGLLAELRGKNRKGDIYQLLLHSPEAESFLQVLSELRDLAQESSVRSLMDEIDVRLGLRSVFGAMENGTQRIINLERFYSIADSYEMGERFGLSGFLRHLELAHSNPPAADLNSSSDTVRIMSIHASKGLEFPVVFLPDLCKKVNYMDIESSTITDPVLGVAADIYLKDLRTSYPTLPKMAVAERICTETLSEEMRILYVAMTRACSRMILSCCGAGMEKKLKDLSQILSIPLIPGTANSVASVGDWVLLAALTRTESGALFEIAGNPGLGSVSEYPWWVCYHEGRMYIPSDTVVDVKPTESHPKELPPYLVTAYAREAATRTPAKLTATQMKRGDGTESKPEIHLRKPGFEKGKRALTGAERGTAIHLAMQYMNFEHCDTEAQVRQELQRLQKKRFLTYEQMAAISVEKLLRFFRSPLFRRIRSAQKVIREFKFTLLEDASYYDPALVGEEILLQGITDCCIIEEDGLVILDFKSDYVEKGQEHLRAEYYRGQLDAYSRALSRIFGLPVKERLLYFFSTDSTYSL